MTKQAVYITKKLAKRLVTIDDDFYARYIPYREMKTDMLSGSDARWYHVCESSYGAMSLRSEIYKWCLENKFRYKKIILIQDLSELQTSPTGILFPSTEDAMAFKLRWL